MPKPVKMYWMRFIVALILIPCAIAFSGVLVNCLARFSAAYVPFFFGVMCYTLTYPVFRKPLLSYVVGHELTHVLGVWLSRGKVYGVSVGRQSGSVKTDKVNVWTALLPYFFPLYTAIVLGVFFILSIVWDIDKYRNWVVFIIGVTWAFHFLMTIYILRQNQPDIKYSGVLFSSVVIFTINVIMLSLLFVFVSPEINLKMFFAQSAANIKDSYLWILKKLI